MSCKKCNSEMVIDKEMYEVKGTMFFAYCNNELTIFIDEYKEELEKMFVEMRIHNLMSGEEFMSCVDSGLFIDDDGSIANIFIDGYQSNLGLCHKEIMQGGFLVDKETFMEICACYKVEVDWANV